MKRYDDSFDFDVNKKKAQEWDREHKAGGFQCSHCKQFVVINDVMGTLNRNHCNICLWSKHVDEEKGDRKSECNGGMRPIGLTFKHEGYDRKGEIMLVHVCTGCSKISINRIARDDYEQNILEVFNESLLLEANTVTIYQSKGIELLTEEDEGDMHIQLFGN